MSARTRPPQQVIAIASTAPRLNLSTIQGLISKGLELLTNNEYQPKKQPLGRLAAQGKGLTYVSLQSLELGTLQEVANKSHVGFAVQRDNKGSVYLFFSHNDPAQILRTMKQMAAVNPGPRKESILEMLKTLDKQSSQKRTRVPERLREMPKRETAL